MSKVERAFDKLIRALEAIGYKTDDAIQLVNQDVEKAKTEINNYYDWLESRIELHNER